MRTRTIAATALAGAALVAALAGASRPAAFHAALKKSWPAAHDTLAASPDSIKLWFSEKVEPAMVFVKLTKAALGPFAYASKAADAPISGAVETKLAAGKYTVTWKVGAKDGHPSNGTFDFVIKGK